MAPIRYSLHYEAYSEHLMSRFGKLLQTQSLVDMTLMCSSHTLRVHKAVLSASSAYFQEVLQKQSGEPLIILKMKFGVLKCLVEFMYCGKTQCLEENMDELVSAAQFLKIKGLSKVTKEGLGITSTNELPVFTPPVVINRPPQSLIDMHSKDIGETKSQPALSSSNASQAVENRKNDMVVRIPFDIESGGNNSVDFADPTRFIRPRRGRPSFRRSIGSSWESGNDFGRATERALLRREQDSRNAIHQLKNLQSRHMQDYMDRITLSQAVNSICNPESSKQSLMNIDNDLTYMDQTMSSDILNPSIPYTKDYTLNNETITSSYSATSSINDSANGSINNAMSQYVNALKNAGLPTDLPILFESGDGSYINVNEQVLLDMVQSSEIQYEVIEQPNIMEKVSDPSEIKSIDDLSKSIERGEMLMNPKNLGPSTSFHKDDAHEHAINSLNEILPDNLDSFGDQQNYVVLDSDLTNNNNSIDNDNTHDFSCIDSDLQFFTKSMSDDVKKYYEEQQLNDARDMEQFCPTSTTLDTSFNMSLLDTKSNHLNDPMNDEYNTLDAPDLSRNEDCFDFESQIPNPNDYKDETLDYLISTSKQNNKTDYEDEKQAQERNEIINDLMNIESKIITKEISNVIPAIANNEVDENPTLDKSTVEMLQIKNRYSEKENVDPAVAKSKIGVKTPNETESSCYADDLNAVNEDVQTKLLQFTVPESEYDTLEQTPKRNSALNKMDNTNNELDKDTTIYNKDDSNATTSEDIPFAVGLLPLKQVQTPKTQCKLKRRNQNSDFMDNVDAKCLKRKIKHKKK